MGLDPYLALMLQLVFPSKLRLSKDPLIGTSQATWQELAKVGTYAGYWGGGFILTDAMLDAMVVNFKDPAISNQRPVTIGHEWGEPEAVGWILDLKVEGDTLLGLIEFNDDMVNKVRSGAYKYFSIEAELEQRDPESGEIVAAPVHPNTGEPLLAVLTGLAVTNQPFIRGLKPITLSAKQSTGKKDRTIYLHESAKVQLMSDKVKLEGTDPEEKEDEKVEAQEHEGCDLLGALREVLGMAELTAEEALAFLMEHAEALAALMKGEGESDEAESETPAEASGNGTNVQASELGALKLALSEYQEKLNRVTKELDGYRRASLEALVDAKIEDGTIPKGKRAAYITLAEKEPKLFQDLTGTDAKKHIHLGTMVKVTTDDTKQTAKTTELSEWGQTIQAQLHKRLGIKPKANN